MNKQIILICGAALLLILLIGCTEPSCGDQECQVGENDSTSENYCPNDCTNPPTNFDDANLPDVPWSFLSMHVENIDDYDQCFDDLVALADEYNTPLTLLLWPSIAEHIQNDPAKLAKMQGWIANGHEIGIHAQYCCTEGQTDTFECLDDGDAEIYNQLVAPHTIKTVHVAPAIIVEEGDAALGLTGCVERLPESAIYSGVGRYDGRSSISLKYDLQGKTFYELHAKAGYAEPLTIKTGQYNSLNSNEIYNFNSHAECDTTRMEEWLQFLSIKDPQGLKRKTQSGLMEDVIIPNDQYIELEDILTPKNEQVRQCSALIGDKVFEDVEWYSTTDIFNFGRCLATSTYCYTDEQCPPGGPYVPTKCTPTSITNINNYQSVSELCQNTTPKDTDCGDGTCSEKEETKGSCPIDCDETPTEITCGDGYCDGPSREKDTCPQDCSEEQAEYYCGNGICDEKELEQGICPEDCDGTPSEPVCGDGICDESTVEKDTCPQDCETPDPGSETCGNNICEEKEQDVGSCPADCTP